MLQQRGWMAGGGVGEPPRCRLIDADERRDETADLPVAELDVGIPQQIRGASDARGVRAEQRLCERHHDGGRQSVSGGVADNDTPGAVVAVVTAFNSIRIMHTNWEEVIEVAARA